MRFYERFASAYGTLVLAVVVIAFFTNRVINLGGLGYIGFPIMAVIYAIVRYAIEENPVLFARKP
ncbi:MAG: hypothetical protein JWN70_247 [Planctomycetaceae bacterium]|nr:hypothetical protein [Planctomycetaceae bacterium]